MDGHESIRIGTAGWTVPRAHGTGLASEGSHLERYAGALNCVEINSTFYRAHQPKTFARWAETTPAHFRFAVKMPKAVTHTKKLAGTGAEMAAFFANVQPLGAKLGPVLVQLPPKLAFDEGVAHEFFTTLRELHNGPVVAEPRHASWFEGSGDRLLKGFLVARAMADPPAGSPAAGVPGGWHGLRYYRLHGAPRKYWSAYTDDYLETLAKTVEGNTAETWVIFDNTAQGHALGDALKLRGMFRERADSPPVKQATARADADSLRE